MFVDREGALSLEPREWEGKRQEIRSAAKADLMDQGKFWFYFKDSGKPLGVLNKRAT